MKTRKQITHFSKKEKWVRGWFGFDHLHTCSIAVNSNEKEGMNKE